MVDITPARSNGSQRPLRSRAGSATPRDTTARPAAARRQGEDQYRALFEHAPDAILIAAPDGTYLDANAQARALLGYEREELLARSIDDVFVVSQRQKAGSLDSLRRGETIRFEREARRKDGILVLVEASACMLGDGRIQAILREITERERPREARLRLLAEHARDIIFRYRFGPDRGFEYVSPAATEITGYTPEEHYADPDLARKLIHPDDRPRLDALLASPDFSEASLTLRWVRKDGAIVWTEQSSHAIRDEAGNVVAIEGIARDVTERRRLEVALRDLNAQLEDRIAATVAQVDQERAHLAEIVASTPGIVWESRGDPSTPYRTSFVSDYAVRWLGYSAEEWLSNRNFWLQIMPQEDRARAIHERAAIFAGGGAGVQRFRWRTREGRIVWAEAHIEAIRDERGVPVGMRGVTLDITARVEAEAALRESDERFRTTFEAAPVGIINVDPLGKIIHSNAAFQDLLGYGREEVRRLRFSAVAHPDDVDEGLRLFDELRTGQRDRYQREARYYRKDGTLIWTRLTTSAVRDPAGALLHTVAMIEDITERKRAEAALGQANQFRERVMESAVAAIAALDLEGRLVLVNRQATEMSGYSPAELIGSPVAMLIPPEERERIGAVLARTLQAGERASRVEASLLRKDGTRRTIGFELAPLLEEGRITGAVGIAADITERRRAEEALIASEAKFRGAFDAAAIGMALVALDGRWLQVNEALCRILGRSAEELCASTTWAVTHPDDREANRELGRQLVAGAIPSFQQERRLIHRDGHIVWAHMSLSLIREGDEVRGVVAQVLDVTERHQARELLERRVAERTQALSTLLDVSREVTSTLDLPSLLGLILDQLRLVVPYDEAGLSLVEGEDITRIEYRGPLLRAAAVGRRIPHAGMGAGWAMLQAGQAVVVGDVQTIGPLTTLAARAETAIHTGAYLGVPLLIKGQAIGMLDLRHHETDYYTQRQVAFAMHLAGQAAIAVENARLYEAAQRVGILDERQRLARELHDSVTQALYGVTMYAGAAERLLAAGEREETAALVAAIGATAQESLQEMRLMLFELRIPTVEQNGLSGALAARVAALRRVTGLLINDDLDSAVRLPPATEEALYRVAQEALTNIQKHARAHHVALSLSQDDRVVTLAISDDGVGFDPDTMVPGRASFGLRGMAERVAVVGGALGVDSAPGRGTMVRAEVPR